MARMRLTKQQQLALCDHRRLLEPHASLQELCNWAAVTFALSQPPSKAMVCRVLRRETVLRGLTYDQLQRRRVQQGHVEALDRMLVDAIAFFEAGHVALNGRLIIWLDRSCAERLNIPEGRRPRFTRAGWLRHFLRRNGIRSRRAHGEIGSVDLVVARAAAEELRTIIGEYRPEDVYNMDEAAFFYKALVRRSLTLNAAPALKQKEARVTMVVAANATGTHKLPITIRGTAKRPRWLPRKPAGVEYVGTSKGWMTTTVFYQWLEQMEEQMAAAGRKILLLVDNAPSHKNPVEELPHVRVEFLPPNTTAAIQPMDQGVIASLKAQIMNRQTETIMQRFMDGEDAAHDIDLVEALGWCKEAWDGVTPTAIQHCWQHAGLYVDRTRIADILNPEST